MPRCSVGFKKCYHWGVCFDLFWLLFRNELQPHLASQYNNLVETYKEVFGKFCEYQNCQEELKLLTSLGSQLVHLLVCMGC